MVARSHEVVTGVANYALRAARLEAISAVVTDRFVRVLLALDQQCAKGHVAVRLEDPVSWLGCGWLDLGLWLCLGLVWLGVFDRLA